MAARKRFGQHFLKDQQVLSNIVDTFAPADDEHILEIGAGTGALTDHLLERVKHLTAIEFDRDLVAKLNRKYDRSRLTVIEGDILKFNITSMLPDGVSDPASAKNTAKGTRLRLIGNLPYNISTPLLFHLLKSVAHIHDMVFMLQKEVAQRLTAVPGSKVYGRLSVMVALELECQCLFDVPPQAFSPPPKVDSTVVRLIPIPTSRAVSHEIHDRSRFNEIVKLAFSQRRKTLRNSLQKQVSAEQFRNAQVDSCGRVENLTVEQFIRLANT